MQLNKYQQNTFNKLLKFDRSFVFWPRQWGKSILLISYLEWFVTNHHQQNILLLVNKMAYLNSMKAKIKTNLGNLLLDRHRTDDLYFINENYLKFGSIYQPLEFKLYNLKPSLILYDEFIIFDLVDLLPIKKYIDNFNCKCVFTSTFIDLSVIKMLDNKNDFYFNIIPPSLKEDDSDYARLYFTHMKGIVKELSYKPDYLLDYFEKIYQRKLKLKRINLIANGI